MLSFFPRDVLDEILDLIESVLEGFPTYFSQNWGLKGKTLPLIRQIRFCKMLIAADIKGKKSFIFRNCPYSFSKWRNYD